MAKFVNFNIEGDLLNISFLVGTRKHGLLYFNAGECFQVLRGAKVYGITKSHNNEWWIFSHANVGKIQIFVIEDSSLCLRATIMSGIPKGIHQIDFLGDDLLMADPHDNRIIVCREIRNTKIANKLVCIYPNGKLKKDRSNYSHFNSVYADKNYIYLIAHNDTVKSKRKSEIFKMDYSYNTVGRTPIEGSCCHNIYRDDKNQIICRSLDGKIENNGKVVFSQTDCFTRGFSIADDYIIFGGSGIGSNENRLQAGTIYITDHDFNIISKIHIDKTQLYEIRRTDVRDYSLINSKLY